jgi:DNA-binding GntR family transcriptional regulator
LSIKDEIVAALRVDIVNGTLMPGQKLSESRLAEMYGVGRTPVREAIKQLEAEKLVSVERRRGTFVKRLTPRDVMDLLEVRQAIEALAAALCAQRATGAQVAELDAILDRMEPAVRAGDQRTYLACDDELHRAIFESSGNPRLVDHYNLLLNQMQRDVLAKIVSGVEGRMDRSLAEHKAIIRAISVRDPQGAEAAMRVHVRAGRHELGASIGADETEIRGTSGTGDRAAPFAAAE